MDISVSIPISIKFVFIDQLQRGRSQITLTSFRLFLTSYPSPLTFSNLWTLTKIDICLTTYHSPLLNVVYDPKELRCKMGWNIFWRSIYVGNWYDLINLLQKVLQPIVKCIEVIKLSSNLRISLQLGSALPFLLKVF